MNEDLHNIDDLFKKALDQHTEMPSDAAWENIDKNLDKKRVAFIGNRYNKLKWIAAALFIFSTGMAMYTWHTKLKNRELVKTIDRVTKNTRKSQFNELTNDRQKTILTEAENEAKRKDTLSSLDESDKSSNKENEVFKQNQTKSLAGDKKEKSLTFEKSPQNFPENGEESKTGDRKQKQIDEPELKYKETLVKKKAVDSEVGKSVETNEEQKNLQENLSFATQRSSYKEIDLKTELPKPSFNSEAANILLQKALATLHADNKIINHEKGNFVAKKQSVKISQKKPVSLTVFFSPDAVSSKVDNDRYGFREEDRHEIKKREKIENAYTTGFLIDLKTGKKFTMESGLTFSSMTTYIEPKQIYARPDNRGNINFRFNCSAGYSYIPNQSGRDLAAGDSLPAFSSKNILEYIAIPIAVKYNLNKGRFTLYPGLGIAVNFLTKGKIETAVPGISGPEKASINHIEGLRKTYLNGSLSLSLSYNLNKTFALNFTPAAKFALTSINKDAPFKTYLNSTALAAGLTIKL